MRPSLRLKVNFICRMIPIALLLTIGLGTLTGAALAAPHWSDVSPGVLATTGQRDIVPDRYRLVSVDRDALGSLLAVAPLEGSAAAADRVVLELPLPDGSTGRFALVESPIMAPELQADYPDIRTYAGYGLDDPTATIRCDLTPRGFHAQILSAKGSMYVDPLQRGDVTHYQSYYKRDFNPDKSLGGCVVEDPTGMAEQIDRLMAENPVIASGATLRTYRAAVAADGEYTIYHSNPDPPSVAAGLAAVVVSINRVSGVYEREVSVRLVLVANETQIIFTDPATDPYTDSSGGAMLGQNQATCDARIGSANYDIGHVFSTGGGGIAQLGCVCNSGSKARGVTGGPNPVGDPFDIDYVAHEMGHQFGSNHSFNGFAGSCNGNRVGAWAYEVGSGSTIMSYAGICGIDNLQPHSDDYFVWSSLREITTFITTGGGGNCDVPTATGVIDPVIDAGTGGFSIPLDTPYQLTATPISIHGAATYCWEEADLGSQAHPGSPTGNAPTHRSFDPVADSTRIFPRLTELLNNRHPYGDLLPTYARNLKFKCTVRDVQAGGVGVANDSISFAVASSGPFVVTNPDSSGNWTAATTQTVTWNVAGTTAAPVSCATVNIKLSVDGGHTWPYTLATATANDGSQTITVPDAPSTQARVKVEAANNIFFDFSNLNFPIQARTSVASQPVDSGGVLLFASRPNPASKDAVIAFEMPRAGTAALRVYDAAGRLVRTLVRGELQGGRHESVWDGRDDAGRAVSSGIYLYQLTADGRTLTGRMTLLR